MLQHLRRYPRARCDDRAVVLGISTNTDINRNGNRHGIEQTCRIHTLNRIGMDVSVFVQALRVLHVACERIQAIEPAIGRIVEAGAEVLLLRLRVEVFAAVPE